MDTNSASSDQAILELKHQWDQLSDIDRARRVVQIKRSSDLSFREIATLLGCNESSLRHIRRGLLAPPADIAAAQEGKISTNQLVDRADAELLRQAELRKEAAQRKREDGAEKGAQLISNWLREQNIPGSHGEDIIRGTRDKFVLAWNSGVPLPQIKIPAGRSPAQLIELCRPKRPIGDKPRFCQLAHRMAHLVGALRLPRS